MGNIFSKWQIIFRISKGNQNLYPSFSWMANKCLRNSCIRTHKIVGQSWNTEVLLRSHNTNSFKGGRSSSLLWPKQTKPNRKKFFVSNLAEIWYASNRSQFHPPHQFWGQLEVVWIVKKIFSFVKFTNNVTSLNSCPKWPSHFGLKFLYKRCVSPSINSNRSDKWQRKDSLNIRKLGILCLQTPMFPNTSVQNKSFQLELKLKVV